MPPPLFFLIVVATLSCHSPWSRYGHVQAFLSPHPRSRGTPEFRAVERRTPDASPLSLSAHTLSTSTSGGPTGTFFTEEKMEVEVGGKILAFETGKIGRSADGSVTVRQGETVVYASACAENKPQELDFTPLRIDYFERFSAAGMTSGSYTKRDGRASDREILVARLIDRPLRPMLTEAWTCETQVLSWVFSYDGVHNSEPMAICAASAAVVLSSIPLETPVAGVQVGRVDGRLVVNPTKQEMANSTLNLMVAGTEEGILMIEGAAEFLPEEVLLDALREGHAAIADICRALREWGAKVGKPKRLGDLCLAPPELKPLLQERYAKAIDAALKSGNRNAYSASLHGIEDSIVASLGVDSGLPDGEFLARDLKVEFKKLVKQRMALMVAAGRGRADGRGPSEVRPISIEMGVLPTPHGSVLFTRGETQALVTVTLGNKGMSQRTESLDGSDSKRFYLQYSFPPSSVGEVGRVGAPGRREIGHGNLAERALLPVIPSEEDFPYALRVESMIMESCGSSSMASACGGSLALMDCGVPLKRHIAGVAMGLLLDEAVDEPIVLTDILGLEDAFGTMDFKICGDAEGVTTFQLDIKCNGLTFPTLEKALRQAKEGRLHILKIMEEACPAPRAEMRGNVMRISQVKINPSFIGKLIGPQGRQVGRGGRRAGGRAGGKRRPLRCLVK
ncbi:polyribonucleotide nucleotidyltransferase [Nannochloropsis gaditana]|uniref:polyribonucleotide nucleotidyltransferase n=1 Tax=Nannochloropsis gaditana TaxID=72520 RepID=W7TFL5_9STRA|nr:polyribonucleotide nucleotidyltransferase [Nannochloropsis gaditana]